MGYYEMSFLLVGMGGVPVSGRFVFSNPAGSLLKNAA